MFPALIMVFAARSIPVLVDVPPVRVASNMIPTWSAGVPPAFKIRKAEELVRVTFVLSVGAMSSKVVALFTVTAEPPTKVAVPRLTVRCKLVTVVAPV